MYAHIYKVVNIPSAPKTRQIICDDLESKLTDITKPLIIDCGSGWGGLCRKLAKKFPNTTVIGYEISPIPYLFSWCIQKISPNLDYTISRQDLFKADLKTADILICYLSPFHMKKFEFMIKDKGLHSALLYSQGFALPNKQADQIWDVPYSLEKKLYRYDL